VASVVDAADRPLLGPLLQQAMRGLTTRGGATGMARLALDMAAPGAPEPVLPLSLSIPHVSPEPGERWKHYKERVINTLGPVQDWLTANAGLSSVPVVSGNSLQGRALPGQVQEATRHEALRLIELDPPCIVTAMDDADADIELPLFRANHPTLDGSGVRVAVLDSGVDGRHPWLQVADSVSTCGESVDIPGRHGTHVAGSVASRDSVYRGVAPGVTLLNVKVLTSLGSGQPTFVTRGIDEALDREAHVLSVSLGFNHLPTWSQEGHGWTCKDGRCQLCLAVLNAVTLEGVMVVVAAGNEHDRASFLRNNGFGASVDSEICCPGASPGALTVGALTKQTFLTAGASSRGPTSFATVKPDIAAPGVNITSSVPARRAADGTVEPNLTRADLSGTLSGTSMATPIVAGAIALLIQRRREAGQEVTAQAVRQELLSNGFRHLASPADEVGVGRLNLGAL
jgi:serine protease AprX